MPPQINEPSNPRHYWRYRLHVTLEQVAEDADLRCLLADMLQASLPFVQPFGFCWFVWVLLQAPTCAARHAAGGRGC